MVSRFDGHRICSCSYSNAFYSLSLGVGCLRFFSFCFGSQILGFFPCFYTFYRNYSSFNCWVFPLVFQWCSYGFPMVFLWFSYGFPMVSYGYQWFHYCFPLVVLFLWFPYGFLWFAYGFPVVFLWFPKYSSLPDSFFLGFT